MTLSWNSIKPIWPFVFLIVVTFHGQPDTVIHESGHLVACYLQGDRVTVWNPITPWVHAETGCANQKTALFTAAGTFTSVLVWSIFTVAFAVWLSRRRATARPWLISLFWLEWSVWCLGEVFLWTRQAREHPTIDDGAKLVAASGIEPGVVIRACLALLFVLFAGVFAPAAWQMWRALRR